MARPPKGKTRRAHTLKLMLSSTEREFLAMRRAHEKESLQDVVRRIIDESITDEERAALSTLKVNKDDFKRLLEEARTHQEDDVT